MERNDARDLAINLVAEHADRLDALWLVRFNKTKRQLGSCSFRDLTIYLSEPFVKLNSEDTVRQVILHEIAHAIAGPHEHHGPKWKRIAQEIGVRNPGHCLTEANEPVPPKWIGTCTGCGFEYPRHRLTKVVRKTARCAVRGCGERVTWQSAQAAA